jgi:copper chaperone CopZ
MNMRIRFGVFLLLGILVSGCFRQDVRTLEVRVPNMNSPECFKIIQSALNRVEGIVSIEPDIPHHKVTVTYNSTKVAVKNIEYVIVGLGFDANDNPGKPEARQSLPADCR